MAKKVYDLEAVARLVAFDAARAAESQGEFDEMRERAFASFYAEARCEPRSKERGAESIESLTITVDL